MNGSMLPGGRWPALLSMGWVGFSTRLSASTVRDHSERAQLPPPPEKKSTIGALLLEQGLHTVYAEKICAG